MAKQDSTDFVYPEPPTLQKGYWVAGISAFVLSVANSALLGFGILTGDVTGAIVGSFVSIAIAGTLWIGLRSDQPVNLKFLLGKVHEHRLKLVKVMHPIKQTPDESRLYGQLLVQRTEEHFSWLRYALRLALIENRHEVVADLEREKEETKTFRESVSRASQTTLDKTLKAIERYIKGEQ